MPDNYSFSIGKIPDPYSVHARVVLRDQYGNHLTTGNYYGHSRAEVDSEVARDAEKFKMNRGLPYVQVDVFADDPRKW